MSYDVQSGGNLIHLQSNLADPPFGLYVQGNLDLDVTRTPVVFGTGGGLISHVKIKRPDGTWATAFQVAGVHVRNPDSTWTIFN